jgi:hypothetical protein
VAAELIKEILDGLVSPGNTQPNQSTQSVGDVLTLLGAGWYATNTCTSRYLGAIENGKAEWGPVHWHSGDVGTDYR